MGKIQSEVMGAMQQAGVAAISTPIVLAKSQKMLKEKEEMPEAKPEETKAEAPNEETPMDATPLHVNAGMTPSMAAKASAMDIKKHRDIFKRKNILTEGLDINRENEMKMKENLTKGLEVK